jgi:hypothetical protein
MDQKTILSLSPSVNALRLREATLRSGGLNVFSVQSGIQARFEIEMGRCGVFLLCYRSSIQDAWISSPKCPLLLIGEKRISILCEQLAASEDKSRVQQIAAELAHVIGVKARVIRTRQVIEATSTRIRKSNFVKRWTAQSHYYRDSHAVPICSRCPSGRVHNLRLQTL